jgi:glycosyltransferase involved in cell wall biosynthesis
LTISIPAYNDAPTIAPLIERSLEIASQVTDDYEVLVINDGSGDNTAEVLAPLVASLPRLRLHTHERNLGFGDTIREAFTLPQSTWVFFIPGDAQIPPDELLEVYQYTQQYDFILGYRRYRSDSWQRKFQSRVYNALISLLARRRIRDVNSGGLLRRDVLKGASLHSKSGFIHAEILLEALRRGARLKEVEIQHAPRQFGEASGNKLRVILATIADLLRYLVRREH